MEASCERAGCREETLQASREKAMGGSTDHCCQSTSFDPEISVGTVTLWVPNWDDTVSTPTILKPKPLWSGKQILSMIILKDINIFHNPSEDKANPNPTSNDGMCIENGKILFSIIDKKTVGASAGGLIHAVF